MMLKDREKKMVDLLSTIKSNRNKAAVNERKMKGYQGRAEHQFSLLANLCPGRSDSTGSWELHGGQHHCDYGPRYCEYRECPMVHKSQRFDWRDENDDN